MRFCLFALFCFFQSHYCLAQQDTLEAQRLVITTSKFAGMCGVVRQLAYFQESTQMPGGNEFIVRFLSTEAARLGYTLEQFLAKCVEVTEEYSRIEKSVGL